MALNCRIWPYAIAYFLWKILRTFDTLHRILTTQHIRKPEYLCNPHKWMRCVIVFTLNLLECTIVISFPYSDTNQGL